MAISVQTREKRKREIREALLVFTNAVKGKYTNNPYAYTSGYFESMLQIAIVGLPAQEYQQKILQLEEEAKRLEKETIWELLKGKNEND